MELLSSSPATSGLGPEWVPGPDGLPSRTAARVILLDSAGRVLLVRGHDADAPQRSWWFTVGGGLEAGESPRAAAIRETAEEAGLELRPEQLQGPVLTRSAVFDFFRVTCRQEEAFFLARLDAEAATELSDAGWTAGEREVLDEMRWWDVADLEAALAEGAVIFPANLPALVRSLITGWDGSCAHLGEVEE